MMLLLMMLMLMPTYGYAAAMPAASSTPLSSLIVYAAADCFQRYAMPITRCRR